MWIPRRGASHCIPCTNAPCRRNDPPPWSPQASTAALSAAPSATASPHTCSKPEPTSARPGSPRTTSTPACTSAHRSLQHRSPQRTPPLTAICPPLPQPARPCTTTCTSSHNFSHALNPRRRALKTRRHALNRSRHALKTRRHVLNPRSDAMNPHSNTKNSRHDALHPRQVGPVASFDRTVSFPVAPALKALRSMTAAARRQHRPTKPA